MELAAGQEFAGFRIVRKLAEGGMGIVYVAEHLSTGRERALKLMRADVRTLDAKSMERFQREARVGAQIKSDHLVEVVDAGFEGHTLWIAMELLEGETLEERLRRLGPLSRDVGSAVFTQLQHGLGHAHAQGLIHRDLKPENIFLEAPRRADVSFTVKILDFGIAVLLARVVRATRATHSLARRSPPNAHTRRSETRLPLSRR